MKTLYKVLEKNIKTIGITSSDQKLHTCFKKIVYININEIT